MNTKQVSGYLAVFFFVVFVYGFLMRAVPVIPLSLLAAITFGLMWLISDNSNGGDDDDMAPPAYGV